MACPHTQSYGAGRAALRRRSPVIPLDLATEELRYLIALSADLKAATRAGKHEPRLSGKRIALVSGKEPAIKDFAFEAAACDQGVRLTSMAPSGARARHKNDLMDITRLLGWAFDAIECRGFGDEFPGELAARVSVPVYSGLSDESDAIRLVAGLLTMQEHAGKPLRQVACCYVGDGRLSLADSLMIMGARLGMDIRICAPYSMWPDAGLAELANGLARENSGHVLLTDDVDQGAYGADFLYAGIGLPAGRQTPTWRTRIELLRPYQGNVDTTQRMHGVAPSGGWHREDGGEERCEGFGLDGLELIDGYSIARDETRNRLHAIKALLVATLTDEP